MIGLLTLFYLACFAVCAAPAIVRIRRRKTSADLSIWREILLLAGVSGQFAVMLLTGASAYVWISPIVTAISVLVLLAMIFRYRDPHAVGYNPDGCGAVQAPSPIGNSLESTNR